MSSPGEIKVKGREGREEEGNDGRERVGNIGRTWRRTRRKKVCGQETRRSRKRGKRGLQWKIRVRKEFKF